MQSRILVVDDELDVRTTIEAALQSERYAVHTAASGDEAISLLEKEPFDLAITDIRMPGTDGVEVLRQSKVLRIKSARLLQSNLRITVCFRG